MIVGITDVVEKFLDYFGEENVEFRGVSDREDIMAGTIALFSDYQLLTIRFPQVKITNENDESTTIRNLFVRLVFDGDNKVKPYIFGMTTSLTVAQIKVDYMHSHLTGLYNHRKPTFRSFCLGTGPIRTTLSSLNESGNEDYLWELFCVELDRMVHVESLTGKPYRYIRNISASNSRIFKNFCENEQREPFMVMHKNANKQKTYAALAKFEYSTKVFFKYLFTKNFNIVNYEDTLVLGYSYPEIIQLFTEIFYEWLNKDDDEYTKEDKFLIKHRYIKKELLVPGVLMDNYFRWYDQAVDVDLSSENEVLINFKGEDYKFEVIREAIPEDNFYYYLHPDIVELLYYKIIELLNIGLCNNN